MASRRAIRIANCSGAMTDPGEYMLSQARDGQVDVITGDYLAEANLGTYAEPYAQGKHPGYASTALDGLAKTIPLLNAKRIKVIINGGALNPKGLAEAARDMAQKHNANLKIAYVLGDDLMSRVGELVDENGHLPHLDNSNKHVNLTKDTDNYSGSLDQIVSASAYLGCRAIRRGLEEGADIIICGRVADASPVMGATQWWHGWKDSDYDQLAGALVAGHLIECSFYVTGANFAGFSEYTTQELLNLACPIAEVDASGECVITKHEVLNGVVTEDTVRCQLLYELQGNIYLNSDVKADLAGIRVVEVGKNRVHVSGVKGHPPPPTTKLAVFYKDGYQSEFTINATGYATPQKWNLQESQIRRKLDEWNVTKDLSVLEFQRIGVPQENPRSQLSSTTSMRVFTQAPESGTVRKVFGAFISVFMQHFAGMHGSLDFRTTEPLPFLAYYPAVVSQSEIDERVVFLDSGANIAVGPPAKTEPLLPRENYDPEPGDLSSFGPTRMVPLGDLVLARSGDKGANVNIGLFVHTDEEWAWLRKFLTRARMQELMGDDWHHWFFIERVELPGIKAVHFVIYGLLGRGVSSSSRLDCLGKGFAEFIRAVHVPIPVKFLEAEGVRSRI